MTGRDAFLACEKDVSPLWLAKQSRELDFGIKNFRSIGRCFRSFVFFPFTSRWFFFFVLCLVRSFSFVRMGMNSFARSLC